MLYWDSNFRATLFSEISPHLAHKGIHVLDLDVRSCYASIVKAFFPDLTVTLNKMLGDLGMWD